MDAVLDTELDSIPLRELDSLDNIRGNSGKQDLGREIKTWIGLIVHKGLHEPPIKDDFSGPIKGCIQMAVVARTRPGIFPPVRVQMLAHP